MCKLNTVKRNFKRILIEGTMGFETTGKNQVADFPIGYGKYLHFITSSK